MRFVRQTLVGVLIVALSLGMLIYAGAAVRDAVQAKLAEEPRAQQPRERVFAVNTVRASLGTETPDLIAFGQIQSRRTLELRAAASGRITNLSPDFVEGGAVRTGEVLMQIDPAESQAALDRVQSDLLDAQAEVRDADRARTLAVDELAAAQDQARLRDSALARQQDLSARGIGSAAAEETAELSAASARQAVLSRRIALAQAEARIDQAATRLARARIALTEAERDLADTRVTAEFDGTLSNVTLVQGRLVSSNEKLADLIDPHQLEVAFRVSTVQYSRLLDGSGRLIAAPVSVSLNDRVSGLTATGVLSRDAALAGEGQSGRLLFARLDAAPGFKPGDFVTVRVQEPPLDRVARLPASALDASGTVLVLGEDERLEVIDVALMRRQGDDVLVRGRGLDGRDVVVARTPLLGPGIRVRAVREGAEQAPAPPAMLQLSDERRARLVAFVEQNNRMPSEAKQRVLTQLGQTQVPAQLVERIESRMGG
ncbi:MAG: efflux transporter periplasmic adaptor subunit [Marinibacterium sp.]|nr:efflux transporter periplasmic adaptor subunit [Marinibacterium sp.]